MLVHKQGRVLLFLSRIIIWSVELGLWISGMLGYKKGLEFDCVCVCVCVCVDFHYIERRFLLMVVWNDGSETERRV